MNPRVLIAALAAVIADGMGHACVGLVETDWATFAGEND
jgi:hypothetical protein